MYEILYFIVASQINAMNPISHDKISAAEAKMLMNFLLGDELLMALALQRAAEKEEISIMGYSNIFSFFFYLTWCMLCLLFFVCS